MRYTIKHFQIVKESLVKRCKCQDISNCAIQTCSLQLAPFIEIAQKIKDIYRRAQHINAEKFTRNTFKTANILNSFTSGMIYLDESPDYCLRNLALGKQKL